MSAPRIHLIAPAGSCRPFLAAVQLTSAAELVRFVQGMLGADYVVTADEALLEGEEDAGRGGRADDAHRARDIELALADDEVAAVVALRGGAWFTRVLPRIDFSVLDDRTRPVAVFGFSELTSLVNVVGAHPRGIGVYDMGPAFLMYGLNRYARRRGNGADAGCPDPAVWARSKLVPELRAYFHDVAAMIEGRGTSRRVCATVVRGNVGDSFEVTLVGGNLTVFSTLICWPDATWFRSGRSWVLLEDFNDKIERFDRFLAHLTLAGVWGRCGGVLLGDFHKGLEDLLPAVIALLDHHLPGGAGLPVLVSKCIGHVWPMSPVPLHLPVVMERVTQGEFAVRWSPSALRTVY